MGAAVAAVKKIGRSDVGQKTMLDVLAPVHEELSRAGPGLLDRVQRRAAADAGEDSAAVAIAARDAALAGAEATIPLVATKGRASYLGERSAGHQDPGATSLALLLSTLADVVG
jgi:dihydroxyacetone kinase-like protein